jgi:hypothetical protein
MNTNGSYNFPCGDRSSLLRRVLNLVGLNSADTAAAAAAAAPSTDSEDEQDTRLRAEAQQPDRLQLSPTGVRANVFKLSASWQPTQKSAARPIKIAPALAAHSVLTMDSLLDFPWLPDSEELQGALGPFEHCQLALAEHLLQVKNGTKTQDVQSSADFAIQWLLEELKLDSAADTAI